MIGIQLDDNLILDVSLNNNETLNVNLDDDNYDLKVHLINQSELDDTSMENTNVETNIGLQLGTVIRDSSAGSKVVINPPDQPIGSMEKIKVDNETYDILEKDPTVPAWAKQPTKPIYNINEIIDGVKILYGTQAEWDSQPRLVSEEHTIYVYTDHDVVNGRNIPSIKIGDGTSYLIDMMYVTDNASLLFNHINDSNIHVTLQEKLFWNNKERCYLDPNNSDMLVFTRN